MQRFTLIHDGSDEGWQAAYLAFHVAVRLGAPLLVLLDGSAAAERDLAERASHVVVGGHAAGLVIETRPVTDFSPAAVLEKATARDGLFVPRHLVADGENALRFLEVLGCPLWVIAREAVAKEMILLANDAQADVDLVRYATTLARRLRQPLRGIIRKGDLVPEIEVEAPLSWQELPDFSMSSLQATLNMVESNLLVMPASLFSLVRHLHANCVIYPPARRG